MNTYTTSEVAKIIGIHPNTVRMYEEWYYYVDHAIRRVREQLEKGVIPEKGTVAWY